MSSTEEAVFCHTPAAVERSPCGAASDEDYQVEEETETGPATPSPSIQPPSRSESEVVASAGCSLLPAARLSPVLSRQHNHGPSVEDARAVVAAASQLKEVREAAERHAVEAVEAVDLHAKEAAEAAEKAANEAKEAVSSAANEVKTKAEEVANAAGAAVDDARSKAAQLADAAGDAVNEVKAKAEGVVMVVGVWIDETKRQTQVMITVVGVSYARFERQISKLVKLGMAAFPVPPARTVGEADDDLVEWKRCRRCQLQFDPAAPWQEGACSYQTARWECGVLEGGEEGPFSFTRRHVFGVQKCVDDCEGRFPCCGARQRLNESSSTGCRTKEMHLADE